MTICELRQRFLKIPILSSNPGRFFSISAVIACLILYPWVAGCIVPCTTKSHLASRDLLIRPRHGLRHLSRFSKSILTSIFLAPIYQFLKKQLNPNENYSKISSEGGLYTCQLSRLFLCRRISCVLLRFVGRKRRSTSSQIMGHMLGDRDARIRLLDHQDCNAFSDCRPVPALVGVSV